MLKKITKKKSLLLTAAILAAMSVPVQAAEKKQEETTHIKTDEVVVTASRTKQEVKESPSSVEVITREDIDKMGAESVAQALQLALGIDTQENAMVGNKVSIRGMNTNQTLILIDGRRVRTEDTDSTMNFYEFERINIDDVERIEIVRGAASSLYGSEALGGVINIIRKRPDEQKTAVTLDWTTRRKDAGIRFDAGKHGNWNIAASFKVSDYRERGTDAKSNMYGKKYFFNIEGRMDVAKDKWLDVFADYLIEDQYMKGMITNRNKPPIYHGRDYDHTRLSTGVKYAGRDKRGNYEMQVYYTRFHKDQYQRDRANHNLLGFDDMTFNSLIFDGKRSMQLSKDHLLTFGGEYRKEDYESTRLKGSGSISHEGVVSPFGKSSVNYAAFYVQDEWLLNPDWLLIPSMRLDHSTSFGSKVTGKLGTTYKINKDLRFKANIGTAYRAPTASELYFDWDGMPGGEKVKLWFHGNPNLKPETSLNFDVGLEMEKDKTFGKITYFHNKVRDLINGHFQFQYMPPPMRSINHIFYVNETEATLQGLEFEVKRDLGSGFNVRGLYTYLDARDGKDIRLTGRPYHKASLQLHYQDPKNGWDATLWNDWIAGYRYEETVGSGMMAKTISKDASLSILNLVVNKKINDHFSAYFGIDNILGKESDVLAHDGRIWRGGVNMTF
ncbi:TonB-dependent receptor [uncultured Selenomonas sp.]|uniref:TonB-dependent receptor plug domain-containing protein n=1 Tax=uncultured Selenomonas sp. TaxID=159275 RepID=UPI0025CEE38D|nr:TonB-dependent receptor [uncultured Selenomonas sp.]